MDITYNSYSAVNPYFYSIDFEYFYSENALFWLHLEWLLRITEVDLN